jgi:hypothetical protein
MNLTYRILWVEDNDQWFRVHQGLIRDVIEDEYGFSLKVVRATGEADLPPTETWSQFDIVLMDLGLVGAKDGGLLVQNLRSHQVLTDVVLYSQAGATAVRKRASDLNLDGVFCADRAGERFEEKVRAVVANTVKKVQDVNNFRGLVVAAAGDTDALMLEVIGSHHRALEGPEASKFHSDLLKRLNDDVEKASTELDKLKDMEFSAILESRLLTAYLRWRTIKRLSDKYADALGDDLKVLGKYSDEVIGPRNKLAHVVAELDEATGLVTLKSLKPGEDQQFTHDWCVDMRNTLKRHRNALERLRASIASAAARS